MKIAHLCLSCFYIDGYAYQENVLIAEHLSLGHEVKVIASTEIYGADKMLSYTAPKRYMGQEGAEVIRLPYGLKPHFLGRKLRWYLGLRDILENFSPDLIFFHGLSAAALLQVTHHVRNRPNCRLIADCHEDFNNSAKSFLSRNILHRLIYRSFFQFALPNIEKIYAVTTESMDFAVNFYGTPSDKAELLPLGGYIPAQEQLATDRSTFRRELQLGDSHIVIAQTGKLDQSKCLYATLAAFVANTNADLRLVVAGEMTADVEAECMPLIHSDKRIHYLGWQTPEQLNRTLAGVDFFLQPFGQTVTTQQAMCSRCAILVQDLPSHQWLFCDNGHLFKDASELPQVFAWVCNAKSRIVGMRDASYDFARDKLDYKTIAIHCIAKDHL